MLCSNQQQIRQCFPFLGDEPPVLVDWLPWNHTFGGNHNIGLMLYNGGTLYIDEGKPMPALIGETLRNLREIAPTDLLQRAEGLRGDRQRARSRRGLARDLLQPREDVLLLRRRPAQPVWDKLDRVAEQTCGERIRMITGARHDRDRAVRDLRQRATRCSSGHIGLPAPGVRAQARAGRRQARSALPRPERHARLLARAASRRASRFDVEGWYCSGDAAEADGPGRPDLGFAFDGRIAEDFKLSTGTFVSVGPLRAKIIAEGDPLVQDVVIAGINRDEIGVLIFPRLDACRAWPARRPTRRLSDGARRAAAARVFPARARSPARAAAAAARRGRRARWCWSSRRRSTAARSPTRARSTSAPC